MKRFWEIDALRGIAVVLMIAYNYLFALNFLNVIVFPIQDLFWQFFAVITAGTFIFLVGVSLTISFARASERKNSRELWVKYAFRAGKIFGFGLLVTLITWLFIPKAFVVFGILHLIGVSVFFAFLLLYFKVKELIVLGIAVLFLIVGFWLQNITVSFPWLVWLGLKPAFSSLDYFPLLPWLGVVLLGLLAGKAFYSGKERKFKFPEVSNTAPSFFCFLGRHSLIIYLFHQPVLLFALFALKIPIGF